MPWSACGEPLVPVAGTALGSALTEFPCCPLQIMGGESRFGFPADRHRARPLTCSPRPRPPRGIRGAQPVENAVESRRRRRVDTSTGPGSRQVPGPTHEQWRRRDDLVEHTDPDLTDAWQSVLDTIAPHQPNRAWLSTCDPVTMHDELAIIAVPDEFTRTQVEGRLRAEIEGTLSRVYGRKIGLGTTINPALVTGTPERGQPPTTAPPPPAESRRGDLSTDRHDDMSTISRSGPALPLPGAGLDQPAPPVLHPDPPEFHDPDRRPNRSAALEARLNPKYTFETFVIGSSN